MTVSASGPGVLEVRAPGGATIARARVALSLWSRTRGLIGRKLEEGEGLLFPGTTSVHTHFMAYPIDLLYLSDDHVVVKIVESIRPWRFSWGGRSAKHVLELPAGRAAECMVQRGDPLRLDEPGATREDAPAGSAATDGPR
jgi:uncharacterized membrane protein (UPF0127 family)